MWELIREGAPLPEAPAWFATRILARTREGGSPASRSFVIPSWVWAGTCVIMAGLLAVGWQAHSHQKREQELTYSALDIIANGDKPLYEEESWFTSY